jgi:hypothetical protein
VQITTRTNRTARSNVTVGAAAVRITIRVP